MEPRVFKVTIRNLNSVQIHTPDLHTPEGVVSYDPLRKKTIEVFKRWLAERMIERREELVVFGSHLYKTLFDDTTSAIFKKEYDEVRNKKSAPLRLVLEFKREASELAELPWEFLYYPDRSGYKGKGFFLAAETQLILTRSVHIDPQQIEVFGDYEPEERPLRVLVLVSEPEGRSEVNPRPVYKAIKEARKNLESSHLGTIKVERVRQKTKDELEELMNTSNPHVLHFIGHGEYRKGQGGFLLFVKEKDHKSPDPIRDEDLSDCFREHQPRLVFLQACEGAHTDSYEAFSGVALKLVHSGVPAVVAMQYGVQNKVARSFAKKFYESLGQNKPIDMAVQEGRRMLGRYLEKKHFSSRAFGSPVVYQQIAKGIVMFEKPPEIETIVKPPLTDVVDCPYSLHRDYECGGKVHRGDKQCITCGRELMVCPNPKCCNIVGVEIGRCGCGYDKRRVIEEAPMKPPEGRGDRLEKPRKGIFQ